MNEIYTPLEEIGDQQPLDYLRNEAKKDLFTFIDIVLKPVGEFSLSDSPHFHDMWRLIQGNFDGFECSRWGTYSFATQNDQHNKKLGLLPRMHGKTKVGTIALSMWLLLKNPDLRILIISETWDNARDMLREIKELYLRIKESRNADNPTPFYIVGDNVGNLWNEDRIIIKNRRRIDKTPSIATAGISKEVTSQHYDVIICDDLVGKENVGTLEQIDKVKRSFAALTEVGDYFADRTTKFYMWGTTWHFSDLYSDILDKRKLRGFYDILHLRCWDEDKNPLFPQKFTRQTLEGIKLEKMTIDPQQWNAQWLNNPVPIEDAIFNINLLQYYDELPKHLDWIICCDLALSKQRWSDESAIVAVGVDDWGRRYVDAYMHFKESDPALIAAKIINMAKPYHKTGRLIGVGIEEGKEYNAVEPTLLKHATWLPLTKLKTHGASKDPRIALGLQPFVATKRIYIRRNMIELKEQMMKFPMYKERDILDALAYHVQIMPVVEKMQEHTAKLKTYRDKFQDIVAGKVTESQAWT